MCQGYILLALDDKSLQQNSANTIRTTRSIFVKNFLGLLIVSSGLLLGSFVPLLLLPSVGWTEEFECSKVGRVKAVTTNGERTATTDFSGSGGQLDPVPLLETNILVTGTGPSCLIANFSSQADPRDNSIVFQVSVDGVPMAGHVQFPGFTTPVVSEPEETDSNLSRMVAYNFVSSVNPGLHTVRVRFAGCCSANTPTNSGLVRAAVLTLQY